jgi:hypothetical protein
VTDPLSGAKNFKDIILILKRIDEHSFLLESVSSIIPFLMFIFILSFGKKLASNKVFPEQNQIHSM